MATVADKLDIIEANIMSGLKDFQRATVCRIAELYKSGQMRVLVSDEVGLGKTLIARGTVAKLANIRKAEGDKLVKVVYICSNIAIADQNLNKLRISSEIRKENAGYSRLSMQHLNIFNQENDPELLNSFIQLIPLTPDTSFRMTSGAGTVAERALMFAILSRLHELQDYLWQMEIIMKNDAYSAWGWEKEHYEKEVLSCNEKSSNQYVDFMLQRTKELLEQKQKTGSTLLKELIEQCELIKANRNQKMSCNELIGKLRVVFAQISLDKLEPDLVIMDEFQRFKYIITSMNEAPDSDTGLLARKFFNSDKVRMLLLSATPYKMYSTLEEIDETQVDEHYSEFLDVMDFLNITEQEKADFKTVWSDYSIKLKEITKGATTVIEAKNAAENAMYQHICRTERISASENADIIDDSDVKLSLEVLEQDIKSYMQAQKLLEDIAAPFNVPVDYIKSTPYIMSFMRDYQLKRHIEKHFTKCPRELSKMNKDTFWLKTQAIDQFEKIPCNNARLERVMAHTFKENAEQLLWVPPSLPYYEPQGVYKNAHNFSKTIVFSQWEMVPRMIAGLLSYEAERKTSGKLAKNHPNKDAHYFYKQEKRYPAARLNFSVSDGKPNAMTLFCLLYPSQFLADCYNPIECLNQKMSLKDIEKQIGSKIKEKIDRYDAPTNGVQDARWYYLAPLLLDGAGYVTTWLNQDQYLAVYDEDDEKSKKQKGFLAHLEALNSLYRDTHNGRVVALGKKPDDLIEVLTDMAIASPAVCIYRTYKKYAKSFAHYLPSQIAKLFLNRMNSPEATAIVKLAAGRKNDDAHWENLLTYCKYGNIQAMFDEYAHLITNGLDKDERLIDRLHYTIADSMNVRTTSYNVDTLNNFKSRVTGKKENAVSLRTHFAVAFTKGDGKEKDADRKKTVRNSFNSPFRPFVLASTSIGQEGLDFHNYCRRIVHWNLPSNPIDLEQREGRINRFECLAIRQNIALRYGDGDFNNNVWEELFDKAVKAEKLENGHTSDLIPFWGLTPKDDMVKIERIVPMYPFSRDEIAYERLIKILSLYRLTLGQARQEELLEYIFNNCENPEEIKDLFINLSPYYKNL